VRPPSFGYRVHMTEIFYEPAHGHGLPHDPFNAIVAPRPIGWIATLSESGVPNLAPYSFFNAFNYRPPIVGFCSIGDKDTLKNVREVPEFSWNLATWELREAMNASSASYSRETNEFAEIGLAASPCRKIRPPRVEAAPVNFECRVTQIVQLETSAGAQVNSWLILGEVVGVHIDATLLEEGIYQTARAQPVLRGGGAADYFRLEERARFQMQRPG